MRCNPRDKREDIMLMTLDTTICVSSGLRLLLAPSPVTVAEMVGVGGVVGAFIVGVILAVWYAIFRS